MDDRAIVPTPPAFVEPEPSEGDAFASKQDKDTAEAYFHPAWVEVEKMFIEAIELCGQPVNPKLPDREYKIEGVSNAKVKAKLTEILQRVNNAVQAVERPNTEPRKSGRKRGGN